MRHARTIGLVVLAGAAALVARDGVGRDAADLVRFPGGARPAVLEAVELPEPLWAIAFSPDGRRAAVATAAEEADNQSRVRLFAVDREAQELVVSGVVRSLLFDRAGDSFFLVVHKPAKRRPGETQLARTDFDDPKVHRLRRLPPTAAALEHWIARDALLIAAQNEIRTLLLDGLRSGPLYRVPGDNRSITSLAGSDAVVVGQDEAVLLINLSDPPGREEMPVRARVASPRPVSALAASTDGSEVLARLDDGRVFAVRFQPLRLEAAGEGAVASAAERRLVRRTIELPPIPQATPMTTPPQASPAPQPPAPAPEPAAAPTPAEPTPPPRATPPPAAPPVRAPAPQPPPVASPVPRPPEPSRRQPVDKPPAPAPAATPPPAAVAEPAPEPSQPSPRQPVQQPPAASPAPPPSQRPPEAGPPQLRGRLEGPAAAEVTDVVLLGPSNLLREAARVRPRPDGTWSADGLEPGRYRVQLDAGGDRLLVCDPPYLILEVGASRTTDAPSMRVLRSYRP